MSSAWYRGKMCNASRRNISERETGRSGCWCPSEQQPVRRNEVGASLSTNETNETNCRIDSDGVAGLPADRVRPARHGRADREGGTPRLQNGEAGKRSY